MTPHRSMAGLTLVEMMIALTISLIVMAAVSLIFANSKKAYEVQDKLARVQENGRFAMNFLIHDIRMAGYMGCPGRLTGEALIPENSTATSEINSTFRSTLSSVIPVASSGKTVTDIPLPYRFDIAIEGFEGDTGSPAMTTWPSGSNDLPTPRKTDTDMVAVRMVDPTSQLFLASKMASPFADIEVTSTGDYKKDDIAMITDCESTSIMQITDVQTGAPKKLVHSIGGTSPGNFSKTLAKAYGEKTGTSGSLPEGELRAVKIFKYAMRRYFIRDNSNGIPSLYRDTNGGVAEELVEGIEELQVLYGVDTDNNSVPDRYFKANQIATTIDWQKVVSVRIGVLARTPSTADADTDRNTYDVNGKSVTPCPALPAACTDRNQRRVFMSTIQLRNFKLPLSS